MGQGGRYKYGVDRSGLSHGRLPPTVLFLGVSVVIPTSSLSQSQPSLRCFPTALIFSLPTVQDSSQFDTHSSLPLCHGRPTFCQTQVRSPFPPHSQQGRKSRRRRSLQERIRLQEKEQEACKRSVFISLLSAEFALMYRCHRDHQAVLTSTADP